MNVNKALNLAFACLFLSSAPVFAQNTEAIEGLLSTDRIGAKKFLKTNPALNGKDIVIAVMDTGVDMAAPGLQALPDGLGRIRGARVGHVAPRQDLPPLVGLYEPGGHVCLTNDDDGQMETETNGYDQAEATRGTNIGMNKKSKAWITSLRIVKEE